MGVMTPHVISKAVNKNPEDNKANTKDTICLFTFIVTLAAWLTMNFIYLYRANIFDAVTQSRFLTNLTDIQNQTKATLPIIRQIGDGPIIWVVITGTIIFLLLLKTLNALSKFWTLMGLVSSALMVTMTVLHVCRIIYAYLNLQTDPSSEVTNSMYFTVGEDLIRIIMLGGALKAASTAKFHRLSDNIKKTSHAVFFFPMMFLFGIMVVMLCVTVIGFTAVSYYTMDNIVPRVFSLLGAIYLISVIFHFAVAVISECIFNWHSTDNKEELSGCMILRTINNTVRNGSGSILFCSTLILPLILSSYTLCTYKIASLPQSGFKAFLVKWMLIGYDLEDALPLISSHPAGVREATKRIYRIFTRSFAVIYSFCAVFAAILIIFLAVAVFVSMFAALAFFQIDSIANKASMTKAAISEGLGLYFSGVIFIPLLVASSVVVFNTAEEVIATVKQEVTLKHDNESELQKIDQTKELLETL